MNRHAIFLTGIAACCASPAVAQDPEVNSEAGEYVIATPAEEAADIVIEIEDVDVLPAQRVIPARRQPVVIRRVIVEDDMRAAGADYARDGQVPHAYHIRRQAPHHGDRGGRDMQTLPVPAGARIVSFNREQWLAECRDRLSTYEESDRGKIIGALTGAALGGLAGNRIAGRGNRTVGTVLGAGAGALAGAAIGDALEGDPQPSASAYGECEAYLDDYMESARSGELQTAPAYYGQEYMLVPVTITIPQRAVYREVEVEVSD